MGNKPKWNEALSNAMRGQLGTTREVFTNSNGSNVILERSGDKWHHEIGTPDVDAEEEDDEPEDEGEEDEEGEDNGTSSGGPSPGSKDRGPMPGADFIPGPGPSQNRRNTARHGGNGTNTGKESEKEQKAGKFFNGKTNAKNEKIKNVYEEMKAQIDKQLDHFYKTGKFTIDPTQMMNKVFHDIMGKYGYKSIFNNWFKNIADKHSWVKKAWETYQQISPKQLTKKLTGKLTLEKVGKFLKLKPSTIGKLNKVFDIVKILRQIKSAPIKFILNAFTKTGGMSADMGALVSAFGNMSASDLLSYVITLLIT